jgi:hypothetical protein
MACGQLSGQLTCTPACKHAKTGNTNIDSIKVVKSSRNWGYVRHQLQAALTCQGLQAVWRH